MGSESENKAERILSIYTKLKEGKIVRKAEESNKYNVAPRTIQRDITDIQCFFQNQSSVTGEMQEIVFDKTAKGYRLETKVENHLKPKELLAVCKVLLESRALVKEEMFSIIYKLMNACSGEEERELVKEFISNEMHHYVELKHGEKLLNRLWQLEDAIRRHMCIKIHYRKNKDRSVVERKIKPVGIMFSEFYFYLTAYIDDIDKETHFQNPEDTFPTIYRVDQIEKMEVLDEHFLVPYRERFEEGEFRKRVQFMYGGSLRKIKFKYKGASPDFILDRLPTAKIVSEEPDGMVIQAEVFGDGIDMWIRSQGERIEMY